ncbi:hypothetical protein GEMRC1_012691 [Eukaryota sp. GEM-RC1]
MSIIDDQLSSDECPCSVGFLEQLPSSEIYLYERQHFPSKLVENLHGFYPAISPSKNSLKCPTCSFPLLFLFQLYTPLDQDEDSPSFHRMIYVFLCTTPACQTLQSSIKVFRSQLPKVNPFYSELPPTSETQPLTQIDSHLCYLCGAVADHPCPRFKTIWYCSPHHQQCDWSRRQHACGEPSPTPKISTTFLLTESFIQCEDEPSEDEGGECAEYEEMDQHEMKEFEEVSKSKGVEVDEAFVEFSTRIARFPEQILRYHRDEEPLISSSSFSLPEVPKCENCGGKRVFEFQILPSIIYIGNLAGVDFEGVFVFTCENSCSSDGYLEEFAVKQI